MLKQNKNPKYLGNFKTLSKNYPWVKKIRSEMIGYIDMNISEDLSEVSKWYLKKTL